MKNRNGFTLIELLSVIAILSILIIIAVPNVINIYNKAKKNVFVNEVQTLSKSANNKYMQESREGSKVKKISNNLNSLDTTGKELKYYFEFNNNGEVVKTIVSDGTYCISTTKKYFEITESDIKNDCSYESLHNIVGTLSKDYYEIAFGSDSNKSLVNSITFYSDGRKLESNATNDSPVDVSEKKDNSILLYANYVNDSSSIMDLYIVSNGKIMFPEDSSYLLAFYATSGCSSSSSITGIYLNDVVDTSKVKNMSYMFSQAAPIGVYCASHRWGCGYTVNRINDLDLSNFDTSKVTDMSYMFLGNQASNIDFSSFNTSSVTNMSFMFFGASAINNLDLSNFDTSKVTNMYSMFDYAKSLITLDLSSFNTSNVNDMSYMFSNTSGLISLNLKSFNTSNVKSMSGMFGGSGLTSIDVSNFDTSNVTDMSAMFFGIKASSILGLKNFDTSNVTNMQSMFSGITMNSLDISNFDTSSVKNMSSMFSYADVKNFNINNFNTNNVKDMSYMFCGCKIKTLDLSSFDCTSLYNVYQMFSQAKTTTVYVKNSSIAKKFNNSSGKPTTLNIIVK